MAIETGHGPGIDEVTRLIEEASAELVLPRFRQLQEHDIERKNPDDPQDLVTSVDRAVEARLTERLSVLAPSAAVVGEEAAHADPSILSVFDTDRPVWVIDPIDGTRNFARGNDAFGIMVAYVVGGATRAAWVLLPARQQLFVAEEGAGAFLNGTRAVAPPVSAEELPLGTLLSRYMTATVREQLSARAAGKYRPASTTLCSAIEYTEIVAGRKDFVVYYRLLPWDHAAPALVVTEAGGRVEHGGGRAYSPRSPSQLTVVAGSPRVAADVRDWFS